MKRLFLTLITILTCCLAKAEDVTVTCHVIDAETKEALPYVSVYATEDNGTLTNYDGDFTIIVDEAQMLRITCVGFETVNVKATALSETLAMKPLAHSMREVRVYSWESIMTEVAKKLDKEYNKRSSRTSQYFMRMTTEFRTRELIEAFVEARSASNLRDVTVLKGRHGRLTQEGLSRPMIASMNFHTPFEVGPMTHGSQMWRRLVTPIIENPGVSSNNKDVPYSEYMQILELAFKEGLLTKEDRPNSTKRNKVVDEYLKKPAIARHLAVYYDITGEELNENEGQRIYRINFKKRDDNEKKSPILTGTLYVDAQTMQMLRFDGQVENVSVQIKKDLQVITSPITLTVHINYRHDKGYTEVSDIATVIHSGDLTSKAILYNVDNLNLGLKARNGKKAGENILSSIDDAGFEEALWTRSNIIQRTKEEERLAGLEEQKEVINDKLSEPSTKMEKLIDRLSRFNNAIPQEKVYLHMDNTCYFLGDTIWFAAYTRQTNNGQPSNISRVLYVELYNQDGYMMERKLIDMYNGRGYGNFALPTGKTYYSGYYELRAYTRWQLNWGRTEHWHARVSKEWFINKEMQQLYYRDYDKLYSRVFPVYDEPEKEGEYAENMTLRPMRRVYKSDPHKRKLTLTFYPEGGNLVEGLPCRVAYEAAWDDGEVVEGKLQEVNAPTVNRGRGTFVITPQKGMERELTFVTAKGEKVKAKLPKAEPEGVALKAEQTDSTWRFDITLSPTLSEDSVGITVMHEGNVLKALPLVSCMSDGETLRLSEKDAASLEKRRCVFEMAHTELREGVNQITVFDVNGNILADRLFMALPTTLSTKKTNQLVTEGIKEMYEPYEKVKMNIRSSQPNSTVSLSVRDVAHSDALYDNATMRTEMLLASEVKGFIPDPQWFFEKDDEEHRTGLDLLMMTQGWRRFNWRDMAVKGAWELTEQMEKSPVIKGMVYENPDWMDYSHTDSEFVNLVKFEGIYSKDKKAPQSFDVMTGASAGENTGSASPDETTEPELDYTHKQIYQRHIEESEKKRTKEVLMHIELVSADGKETRTTEQLTNHRRFQFLMPGFYGDAVLFISASDSTKWKKGRQHTWIQQATNVYNPQSPEFAVRLNQPHPRFVKPYHYYQQQLLQTSDSVLKAFKLSDGTTQMREVKVGTKRSRLNKFSDSIPALIVDAYQAYNDAIDAGMLVPSLSTTESRGLAEGIVRTYVGDYGMEFPYIHVPIPFGPTITHSNIEIRFAFDQTRRVVAGYTTDADSTYQRNNLISFLPFSNIGEPLRFLADRVVRSMYKRTAQDKYVIYTDYQPRLAGNERYHGSDLPNTQLAIYLYPDDSERVIYRDRRYVFHGYAYPDDFYHPNYENRKLDEKPKDYRRTLYWNPALKLDKNGRAEVTFYNNGKHGQISVSAEGLSDKGEILGN